MMRLMFMIMVWLAIMLPGVARAQSPLPDPAVTPGARNPAVTPRTMGRTICRRGWTRQVRPPERLTERLKMAQIRASGDPDQRPWHYEEDHLIPLDLGGSPTARRNLWPEPHLGPTEWGAYAKDRLEVRLAVLVCRHEIPLVKAQAMIAHDWIAAYQRYVGPAANNHRPVRWHDVWHHGSHGWGSG